METQRKETGMKMNNEMMLELEKLRPETREQMAISNATWIRLRKLEQERSEIEIKKSALDREIQVMQEDHKIQQGKLSKLLLEEKL